jgi:hypothetical protein
VVVGQRFSPAGVGNVGQGFSPADPARMSLAPLHM